MSAPGFVAVSLGQPDSAGRVPALLAGKANSVHGKGAEAYSWKRGQYDGRGGHVDRADIVAEQRIAALGQGGSQGGRPQCMDIVEDAEGGTFTEDRRERFPPFRLLPWGRLHRRLVACGGHDDRTCQERFPGAGLRRLDDSKGDRAWDGRTEDGRQ